MQVIKQFDPSTASSGVILVGAADQGSKMLLYNKSPLDLQLDFLNGSQSIAHAKQARVWTLDGDTKQINWTVPSQQKTANPAQSIVQGELYNPDEPVEGTYPVQLDTQTDFGNRLQNTGAANLQPLAWSSTTGITLTQVGSVGVTNYISGLSLTSQITTTGTVQYSIQVTNIIQGQSLYFFGTANTTTCANIQAVFTPSLPTYQAGLALAIIITITGAGTGGNYSVIAPIYQV